MTNAGSLARIAALIGDPARAAILIALMDGRALTAGELARAAGVTPPTASEHLGRMMEAGLLAVERQGRHRYYRIESASVAALIENLMAVSSELRAAASAQKPVRTGPSEAALRHARLCYDHLAGEVAVAIASSLSSAGHLQFGPDGGAMTDEGRGFLAAIGVELPGQQTGGVGGPMFCRPCLDWSERRPHIAGQLGRAIYGSFLRLGWIRAPKSGRAVIVTPPGRSALHRHFGL